MKNIVDILQEPARPRVSDGVDVDGVDSVRGVGIDMDSNLSNPKTVEEELEAAYLASDTAVQRAEYVLRGLNAAVSGGGSFVSSRLAQRTMAYEGDNEISISGEGDGKAGGHGHGLTPEDCC